jgi:hypothetical protein
LIEKGLGYYRYCGVESKPKFRSIDLDWASKKCVAANSHKGFKVSHSISLKNILFMGVKVSNTHEMRIVIICVR